MKAQHIKFASPILILLLISALNVSAGFGNRNHSTATTNQTDCLEYLPNLSSDQIKAISQLDEQHQKVMDQLRTERRSTSDERSKTEIRLKMLDQRDVHRAEVKKLLSPEQQLAFDQNHRANEGKFQANGHQRGHKNRTGCGTGSGRSGHGQRNQSHCVR